MKRILSFFLALSLVAGLMAGITLTAAAEDTVITEVSVTGAGIPGNGGAIGTAETAITGSDAYYITRLDWYQYDYSDDTWCHVEGEFDPSCVYQLELEIAPANGYVFDAQTIIVDGLETTDFGMYGSEDGPSGIFAELVYLPDDITIIDTLVVETLPAEEVGSVLTADQITVPEDANYSVGYVFFECYDADWNWYEYNGEPMQEGYRYEIGIHFAPAEGYWIADGATVITPMGEKTYWNYCWITYNLLPVVDSVAISGLPGIGDTVTADSLQVPADANYTISYVELQHNWETVDSFTYSEDYGSYYIHMQLTPAEGYIFELGNITVNGIVIWECGWEVWEYNVNDNSIYLTLYTENRPDNYAWETFIRDVPADITVGEEIVLPDIWIEGEGTYITGAQWLDSSYEPVSGTFEESSVYYLAVDIALEEGYGVDGGLWVYVLNENGHWISNEYCSPNTDGSITAYIRYSTLPTIDSVEVTVEDAVIGGTPAVPTIPEDANYYIGSYNWYDTATGEAVTKFEDGHKYQLYIELLPNEGYEFADELDVNLNGEWADCNWDATYLNIWMTCSFLDVIERVDVTVTEPVIGGAPTVPTVPADSNYTLMNYWWCNIYTGEEVTKFEDGQKYILYVELLPDEGYEFMEDMPFYVNGEVYTWTYQTDYLGIEIMFSFLDVIDSAEVTVTAPVVGGTPAVPAVSEDANYTISYYRWYNLYTGDDTTKFEDGQKYILYVELCPKQGYEFADEFVIYINGEENENHWGDSNYVGCDTVYSFTKVIDRIDITVPELTLGSTMDMDAIKVTTEGISIDYSALYSYTTGEELTGAAGKDKYALYINLTAENGYELAEDFVIYINGEETEYFWGQDAWACANVFYDFREEISKVEISGLPTDIKVGNNAEAVTLTTPDGAHYTVETMWGVYLGDYSLDAFEGKFEDKNTYYLAIGITPNTGYKLADDVVITVNGKEFKGACQVRTEYAYLYKQYVLGLQVIDTIELTVETPENGKAPSEITVPKDAAYEVLDGSWARTEDMDLTNAEGMEEKDVFEYGYYYWIAGSVQAKEGYVFAEDVVIKINGEAVETGMEIWGELGIATPVGDIAFFAGNLGQLMKPDENPKTGDASTVLVSALAVLAVTGTAVAVVSRKKFF